MNTCTDLYFLAVSLVCLLGKSSVTDIKDTHEMFGAAIGPIGDVDSDGVSDFFVSDPKVIDCGDGINHQREGAVWVFSGKTGVVLKCLRGAEGQRSFGRDCREVGDIRGDGKPNLAVISGSDPRSGGGRLQVFSCDGWIPVYDIPKGVSSVSKFGDIDRDGKDDLLVVCIGETTDRGREWSMVALSCSSGKEFFRHSITFFKDEGWIGMRAASPGDVNGDSIPDVAIIECLNGAGGPIQFGESDSYAKAVNVVRVISGKSKEQIFERKIEGAGGFSARLLDVCRDLNGDGIEDLVVGFSITASRSGSVDPAQLISGATGELIIEIEQEWGSSIGGAGDVNGDGVGDLLVGAQDRGLSGCARVLSGRDGVDIHQLQGVGSHFGYSVSGVGDLDGDGKAEFMVASSDPWAHSPGVAQVFLGSSGSVLYTLKPKDVVDKARMIGPSDK